MAWAIVLLGVALRLIQYLSNRSLWVDEAALALNIVNRSYDGLLQPLNDNQAAPLGFLFVEKLMTQVFGNSEYALRLFPLIAGIGGLILFAVMLNRWLPTRLRLVPLFVFAVSVPLIYYSSETKQYSSDLTVNLMLLMLALSIHEGTITAKRAVVFGLVGAAALWFSHGALFTLAGIGVVLFVSRVWRRDWLSARALLITGGLWAVSFAALYSVSLRQLESSGYLRGYFQANFMPLPPSLDTVRWLHRYFLILFDSGQSIQLNDAAALLFVVGCVALYPRQRERLFVLIAPMLATLLASAAGKYPFGGRLFLYAIPTLLLLVGDGLRHIAASTRRTSPALIGVVIAFLLVNPLLALTGRITFYPQEIKPVLAYVSQERREGDLIYVYYFSQFAYEYYAERYDLSMESAIIGRSWVDNVWNDTRGIERMRYTDDLSRLRGAPRVWLIFTNAKSDENLYTNALDNIGEALDTFHANGASAYLFDLSGE